MNFKVSSFVTVMSVSEYVRCRRLSQAVFDIQNSKGKIADIALKYGYESLTGMDYVLERIRRLYVGDLDTGEEGVI